MADTNPSRTSLRGSCHCGAVRYILFLSLPHAPAPADAARPPGQRIYRCNCTICHKTGFFHLRPAAPADDFVLLAPLDPVADLADYRCASQRLHFLSCPTCAVRCFIFAGEGETVDVDLALLGVAGCDEGHGARVWRAKHSEAERTYLSVNGHTIDAGQALDMRGLAEAKAVQYLDYLHDEDGRNVDRPHPGGCY